MYGSVFVQHKLLIPSKKKMTVVGGVLVTMANALPSAYIKQLFGRP